LAPEPPRRFASEGRLVRLGDEAALFDPGTWSTHVLNEDAAELAVLILDRLPRPASYDEAMRLASDELGWDPSHMAAQQTLLGFVDAGLVQPPPDR
jgi:PqqD family protein of HPr-rel-A system